MSFKLTYATMFNPPADVHRRFDAALAEVNRSLGATHALYINGEDHDSARHDMRRSPIDQRRVLGHFPLASVADANDAMAAAQAAFPSWRAIPMVERVRLLKRVATLIEERVYHIAAALTLEVGKNRMEGLGEGPVAAALITGNTVVLKTASDTPWSGRLLADCLRDAGIPRGVFNYLNGRGSVVGETLLKHANTAGITFTGSFDVGMHIYRSMANGGYPRPCVTEMGGKNACIVTANADLERAADGIVRSAYGLSGQKCSAVSRIYVDDKVADASIEKLRKKIAAITIGDPSRQENWLGPVTTANALQNYQRYSKQLTESGGRVVCGGQRLTDGGLAHGYFVAPTLAEAPATHPLFAEEMFVPIAMLCRVRDRSEAIRLANDSRFGLTAGCYGNEEDAAYFFENIEAGVTYVNRPQGATTGAWPGYQPFGGWKGSGSSGKGIASFYYLAQYLREQSQTKVE